jgi:hypothetical protein
MATKVFVNHPGSLNDEAHVNKQREIADKLGILPEDVILMPGLTLSVVEVPDEMVAAREKADRKAAKEEEERVQAEEEAAAKQAKAQAKAEREAAKHGATPAEPALGTRRQEPGQPAPPTTAQPTYPNPTPEPPHGGPSLSTRAPQSPAAEAEKPANPPRKKGKR